MTAREPRLTQPNVRRADARGFRGATQAWHCACSGGTTMCTAVPGFQRPAALSEEDVR
jgi:hypothetical protein